ncbi:MAG: hypothetical protein LBO67_00275 [Spirochaetaceae bacterium]|jgi:hypothetical protein|nr:hypothetical protein [Spirochaetaceae bacterium]
MKKLTALLLGAVLSTVSVFSIDLKGDLENKIDSFSKSMAGVLPFTATIGLNWSDAYIGNFPHFGVGLSGGFTAMNIDSFDELLDLFGADTLLPSWLNLDTGILIPAYALEARLGGLVLPFDIGVKFGYIPQEAKELLGEGIRFDYLTAGAEIRYALLKQNLILPNVSVGVGYNYLKGSIGMALPVSPGGFTIGINSISVLSPILDLLWETHSIDFNAQVSKSFLILTPYLGMGASYAKPRAGYKISAKLDDTVKDQLEDAGIDFDDSGFSAIKEADGWGYRAFGGLSFDLLLLRFDLTALYSFGGDSEKIKNIFNGSADLDGNWGITFGIRCQL